MRAVSAIILLLGVASCSGGDQAPKPSAGAAVAPAHNSVVLRASQLGAISIVPASVHRFATLRTAVGSVDFDENVAVQVFSPYQGKIIRAYADIGDDVRRGATLYTIDSPDLLQAESALISAAGVADLTAAALARAKDLFEHEGMAQKDYQQAVSDQMSAEGSLKAARDAVRIFGKSEREIHNIIAERKVDSILVIASPVNGHVTARFAQHGLLVQPGAVPAPYAVADSKLWMLANVTESDVAALRLGQEVTVDVTALDNRHFKAAINAIGATIDPSTHTALVRSEVEDPHHQLRPGMMATFVVRTGEPVDSVAVPVKGAVREGDGTMSIWTTSDRHTFQRRTVTVGLQQDGFDQILAGLRPGELIVADGAILLSNELFGGGGAD
jgi:membrane fusion protein, heavy metal efflux system